jgi:hypothetical protein
MAKQSDQERLADIESWLGKAYDTFGLAPMTPEQRQCHICKRTGTRGFREAHTPVAKQWECTAKKACMRRLYERRFEPSGVKWGRP